MLTKSTGIRWQQDGLEPGCNQGAADHLIPLSAAGCCEMVRSPPFIGGKLLVNARKEHMNFYLTQSKF